MAELNPRRMPHAMAITGALEAARAEALQLAEKLVGDIRIGLLQIEPENGLIKIEAAHRINSFFALTRVTPARAVLIAEAHMLNPQATNAILKIVEEPPPESYFFFLTPEVSQLLPTLRSRLQVLRLKPGPRQLDERQRELHELTVGFVRSCLSGRREAVPEFLDATKDRDSALEAAWLLQLVLRDWTTGQNDHGFPDRETYDRVELWRFAHQIEADLHGHVDRALAFENFYYRAAGG